MNRDVIYKKGNLGKGNKSCTIKRGIRGLG